MYVHWNGNFFVIVFILKRKVVDQNVSFRILIQILSCQSKQFLDSFPAKPLLVFLHTKRTTCFIFLKSNRYRLRNECEV